MAAVFLAVTAGTLTPARAQSTGFTARLSGQEQVPVVSTAATGLAVFQLNADQTRLFYRLEVQNIQNVLMAHIHIAPTGQNGPVAVWLYPPSPPPVLIPGLSSGILQTGTITAANLVGPLQGRDMGALIGALRAGNAYVNVHTSQFPGGEIRGQIR